MKTTITKLERPEHYGDWHDRPLKWVVTTRYEISNGDETQKFCTKADALLYAKIRRNCSTQAVAIRTFSARTA